MMSQRRRKNVKGEAMFGKSRSDKTAFSPGRLGWFKPHRAATATSDGFIGRRHSWPACATLLGAAALLVACGGEPSSSVGSKLADTDIALNDAILGSDIPGDGADVVKVDTDESSTDAGAIDTTAILHDTVDSDSAASPADVGLGSEVGTHDDTASAGDTASGSDTPSGSDTASGGDTGAPKLEDKDNDGFPSNVDCDDNDDSIYPGSMTIEVPFDKIDPDCDGKDYCTDLNCDGRPDILSNYVYPGPGQKLQYAHILSGPKGYKLGSALTEYNTANAIAVDLNKDGYLDVVNPNHHKGQDFTVPSRIHWGSKDGYTDANSLAIPTVGAIAVCAADFNKDDRIDLFFANATDGKKWGVNSQLYYANDTTGFVGVKPILLPTLGASSCHAVDLNKDGWLDLVVTNKRNDANSYLVDSYIYWGGKSGFKVSNRTDLPTRATGHVTIDDINQDGYLDLLFASPLADTTYDTDSLIYWGSKQGFDPKKVTGLFGHAVSMTAVADLNKDGYKDVVLPGRRDNAGSQETSTFIYWGAKTGFTSLNKSIIKSYAHTGVIIDDINQDGYLDLLISSFIKGVSTLAPSSIYWGSASGTFTDKNKLDLLGYGVGVAMLVHDLNHDGYKDVYLGAYMYDGWSKQPYTRIYWGSVSGLSQKTYSEFPTWAVATASLVGQ